MKIVYQSILGGQFDTAALAMADEDRLPRIIATYEKDLARIKAGEDFAGKPGPHPQDLIDSWTEAVAGYKAQWAEVQRQRNV